MNFQQFLVLPAISNSLLKLFKVQGSKAYEKKWGGQGRPSCPTSDGHGSATCSHIPRFLLHETKAGEEPESRRL